jgi:hypothetical protein
MESDADLATRTIEATCAAGDLEGALDALVTSLRQRFELWYACFASHPTDAAQVTILSAWSFADSVLDTGAEVSASIAPLVTNVLTTLREGSGARFTVGVDNSLIDHLLKEQGVASGLCLPVQHDERAPLLLALGSSSATAFQETEPGFFTTVTAGIRPTVLRLASATNP